MPSASEQIKALQAKQAAERAAREAVQLKASAASQRENQRVEDEHKRKLQHSREVADRVLRESGVLAEVQAIKRDHIDGKFPKSVLLKNYSETGIHLMLAWGSAFEIKDGNIGYQTGWFGAYPHILDYCYMEVTANADSQTIAINHEIVVKDEIQDVLAQAFLNPLQMYRQRHSKFTGSGPNNFPVDFSHLNSPGG